MEPTVAPPGLDHHLNLGERVAGHADHYLLNAAHANFSVQLVPAAALLNNGDTVPVPGYRFVVAGDIPVGQVGSRWHPIQNLELVQFAQRIGHALNSTITTAGVTQGNRKFWCYLPAGDIGLLVATAHDGRGAVSVQIVVPGTAGLIRLGPEDDATLSFPHGPTLQARLDNPSEVASWVNRWTIDAQAERQRLKNLKVDNTQFLEALEGVVPASKATTERKQENRHAILDRVARRWVEFSSGERDGWSLLEAVAGYLDSDRRGTKADRDDQAVDDSGWVTRAKYQAHAALS